MSLNEGVVFSRSFLSITENGSEQKAYDGLPDSKILEAERNTIVHSANVSFSLTEFQLNIQFSELLIWKTILI